MSDFPHRLEEEAHRTPFRISVQRASTPLRIVIASTETIGTPSHSILSLSASFCSVSSILFTLRAPKAPKEHLKPLKIETIALSLSYSSIHPNKQTAGLPSWISPHFVKPFLPSVIPHATNNHFSFAHSVINAMNPHGTTMAIVGASSVCASTAQN